MRRHAIACCMAPLVALMLAAPAMAQNAPKVDVAASFSALFDKELSTDLPGANGWLPSGWLVSGAARVIGNLSLVGEVGANYSSVSTAGIDMSLSVFSALGGVRYTAKAGPRVLPFVQLLFGLARLHADAMGIGISDNEFATQVGGGVDVAISPKLAVRLQGDYRALRSQYGAGNEFRLATGIVYHF